MTTVTAAAATADPTQHAGAADGLGGPRDRASCGYVSAKTRKNALKNLKRKRT